MAAEAAALIPPMEVSIPNEQYILSHGMGVESVAIQLRWMLEPETCPCKLEDLITITAQTGAEYEDTKELMERHILPLMRERNMRYVQVARAGHLEQEGIVVLDDSRLPQEIFWKGVYKLDDELSRNGTVPQFGGQHRCSLKFKAFVIETWLDANVRDPMRHAFGYNAEETKRVAKCEAAVHERIAFGFNVDEEKRWKRSAGYNNVLRTAFYPLVEWGWDRAKCLSYILEKLGVLWKKSACVYCPFNRLDAGAVQRHMEHPGQVAQALTLEYVSMSMNPRGMLYKNKALVQITENAGNQVALDLHQKDLLASEWALYRVRRLYSGPGKADRAVELISRYETRAAARDALLSMNGEFEERQGIWYMYRERRRAEYPAREDFWVAAPARVEPKARYGFDWFEGKWAQEGLFDLYCGECDADDGDATGAAA